MTLGGERPWSAVQGKREPLISVDKEERGYYKELDLPESVEPKGVTSTFNNGVLEVSIPLKTPGAGGVKVRVD